MNRPEIAKKCLWMKNLIEKLATGLREKDIMSWKKEINFLEHEKILLKNIVGEINILDKYEWEYKNYINIIVENSFEICKTFYERADRQYNEFLKNKIYIEIYKRETENIENCKYKIDEARKNIEIF